MYPTTSSLFTAATLLIASFATALPPSMRSAKRQASVLCSGASATPNCCAVNVLDVADLQCADPPTLPTDVADFTQICANIGQEAQCCTLDLLDQGLLCTAPQG